MEDQEAGQKSTLKDHQERTIIINDNAASMVLSSSGGSSNSPLQNTTSRPHTARSDRSAGSFTSPLAARPKLKDRPTTQLSSFDIQTLSFPDGTRGTFSSDDRTDSPAAQGTSVLEYSTSYPLKHARTRSTADENASIKSLTPSSVFTGAPGGRGQDLESLLHSTAKTPAQKLLASQADSVLPFCNASLDPKNDAFATFDVEFDEVPDLDSGAGNEEVVIAQFKAKMKHYMILTSAGKPVWSRHGDINLINSYIGIISTIISSFTDSPLRSFKAGNTTFTILTKGPLYFVAISKIPGESETEVRSQLEGLYMQILSTLTLPRLERMFAARASTDLRRPLEGTEGFLSSLCDTFTAGSSASLLSSLECLRLRKSHRAVINNTLLAHRSDKLLYGLIVAGGKLVSVLRPKRHSLHPGDLRLVFNMLFEAGSIRSSDGGENWIPVCLPGFESKGYLYMYVSFVPLATTSPANVNRADERLSTPRSRATDKRPQTAQSTRTTSSTSTTNASTASANSAGTSSTASPRKRPRAHTTTSASEAQFEVAIVLISTDRETFFELKSMRDACVAALAKNNSLKLISQSLSSGHPITTSIVPGTQIRHFIYKSRTHVQFISSSYSPHFTEATKRRRLMSLYSQMHAEVHTRGRLRVLCVAGREAVGLAWVTGEFEFFCVAGPNTAREALLSGANGVVGWVNRERERLFIVGGAVF